MTLFPESPQFEEMLRDALHRPERVNFNHLLQVLEMYLEKMTQHDQLLVAGNAFVQLTELYKLRAERLLHSWEENYSGSDKEPVITDDMLIGLLRQSMALDIDDILEENEASRRTLSDREPLQDESIAGSVDKENLLDVLNDIELKKQALHIAHDEHISDWVQAIHQWMNRHRRSVSLQELADSLCCCDQSLTLVKVWLGLLCGGYSLEQRGEFYEIEGIWIHLR
jgi:hypothetical protein